MYMKKILIHPTLIGLASMLFAHTSCTVEDLDINELNTDSLYVQTALDVPIAHVTATVDDILRHEKCQGKIITPDTTITIEEAIREFIALPITLQKGTYLEEEDAFKNLPFPEQVGEGNLVDYIESFILKVEVENKLPFSIDYKLAFYHKDTITGKATEIEDLKVDQTFTAEAAEWIPGASTIARNKITKHQFRYNNSHTSSIRDINHIKVSYRFYLNDYDEVVIHTEDAISMKISCYFKGGLLVNKYEY